MIDRWDIIILLGAVIVAAGWYFVWWPAALFWLGAVVIVYGVLGARK